MINPKFLRNNIEEVSRNLFLRNFILDVDKIQKWDKIRKNLQLEVDRLRSKRILQAKKIHILKIQGSSIEILKKKSFEINQLLNVKKIQLDSIKKKINDYYYSIPNLLSQDVPLGNNQNQNIEIKRWGNPKNYQYKIKNHVEIGENLRQLSISRAAKISGSRFVLLCDNIAHMHRALSQFMMDLHTIRHGYTEYYLPYLVHKNMLYGTGQLPKFYNDFFYATSYYKKVYHNYALIPTAEVPLINLMRNEILEEKTLPIKMTAHTPCFRSEAGSYGQDTRGLIRVHQFDKVEIVQIVKPEQSMQALEEITLHAEHILELLCLPYRKMLLCAGDTGFSSCKTYDLEVWMPAQNVYKEVSSCSNTSDFQSRRIKLRYKDKKNKKIQFVHALNGSALAIGRTLAAIIENYQTKDGYIVIPKVLRSYMQGKSIIQ